MTYEEVDLAEICGIHAGDGWMGSQFQNYEVGYGTSKKETDYFDYVCNLYNKVFSFKCDCKYRIIKRDMPYNCIELRIASKKSQNTLMKLGFPR